ncbi:MAG: ATP-grasp domain-containing protein [Deltaproteobacteria bacterium]|jgi:D-alanine-D-alanine ligase|nr:ATP-grasp domain-containing protein [Deltaproteobacteria bacterium]
MKVGITYDLIDDYLAQGMSPLEAVEFDSPITINAIKNTLESLGHNVDCIGNAIALMKRLLDGDRWDFVFNIAEGLHGLGREAQVPAILDVYNIPYTFSDTVVLALTLNKAITKRVICDFGLKTPNFKTIEKIADLAQLNSLTFPLFAKPIGEGTGKGVTQDSYLPNIQAAEKTIKNLLTQYHQPVLVEEYLPGREFTIAILGTGTEAKVIGTTEIFLTSNSEKYAYTYLNKVENLVKEVYLSQSERRADKEVWLAEDLALQAHKALNCRDVSRVDIRSDANGVPHFIEINAIPGIRPEYSDLPLITKHNGLSYQELIAEIIKRVENLLIINQAQTV